MRNVHFHPWALGSVSPGCNEIRGRHRVQWTHQLPVTPPPHHHRISTQLATQSSHTVKSHSPLVTQSYISSLLVTQSYGHTVIWCKSDAFTMSICNTVISYCVILHSHLKQSSSHTVIFTVIFIVIFSQSCHKVTFFFCLIHNLSHIHFVTHSHRIFAMCSYCSSHQSRFVHKHDNFHVHQLSWWHQNSY